MDEFEKFYNTALRFLSYRPRSEKEVRDALQKKKASIEVIEKIISRLKEHKFLNDADFVQWWVESRTRFKPRGIKLIILELKQKGISEDLINSIIHDSLFMIQSDLEQAKKLAEKKIEKYKGLTKNELYQKLGGFLARRGFNYETVKKVIDEVTGNRV